MIHAEITWLDYVVVAATTTTTTTTITTTTTSASITHISQALTL